MTTTARATTAIRSVLVLACALALAPAEAGAHGEASPLIRAVIDRVEPAVDGVDFTPLKGPASLVRVVNRTREDVDILSADGEPFLRVGPRGVYGNVASPAWYESGNPDGQGRPDVRTGNAPRWRLFARRASWEYYDHRLHPSQIAVPPRARRERRPVKLLDFAIPFRHGGRPASVRGHLQFRPIVGTLSSRMETASRPLPGVTVTLLPGAEPGFLLQNVGRSPVVVGGRAGEPYARIGPRGVEVNLRSPLHVEILRRRGELPSTPVDARARPLWRRLKSVPSFAWSDPRVRYVHEQPPDAVLRAAEPVRLFAWNIPLRAGARRATVTGTTSWIPTDASGLPREGGRRDDDGGGGTGGGAVLLVGAAAAVALAVAAAVRVRLGLWRAA